MAETQTKEPLLPLGQKKKKEDEDDTTSYEGDSDKSVDDYVVSAKKTRRARRQSYKKFKTENKGFWMWFNLLVAFFSAGFLTGTYLVLTSSTNDCSGLALNLYVIICLHSSNIIMCLVNLCGLETKICNQNAVCCYMLFELAVLVFMQVSYFNSQYNDCFRIAPDLYLWTMGQILAVYMGLAIVICHFFRKFCQDPDPEEEAALAEQNRLEEEKKEDEEN